MSDSSAEKTEDATSKKLQKAREKGQLPRSKDLTTAALILGCPLLILNSFDWFASGMNAMSELNFALTKEDLLTPGMMERHLTQTILGILHLLSPVIAFVFALTIIAGSFPGGMNFSVQALGFKPSKMSPMAGIKRMFSMTTMIELLKSVLKISLLLGTMIYFLYGHFEVILTINKLPLDEALTKGFEILSLVIFYLGGGLLVIAGIDVPYQMHKTAKDLRMTKQEVKDEYKQVEGNPMIKAKIRAIMMQTGRARAEISVPQADVILVNPTHYAVALKYDPARAEAPFVIGKGVDEVALYMRELAKRHNVEIVSAPPLARSVYYSTQIEQQIPAGLFVAVAHVLHYVLQIKAARSGRGTMPSPLPTFNIPAHLRKD